MSDSSFRRLTAVIFFVSYAILGTFVILNVFIAVILDAFAEDQAADQMAFNQAIIDDFVEAVREVLEEEDVEVAEEAVAEERARL